VNVVVVAAEVLIWEENGFPTEVVIPIFAVINIVLTGILIVGYTQAFGFTRMSRPRKAKLVTDTLAAMPQ
jgi:hypothetical protein